MAKAGQPEFPVLNIIHFLLANRVYPINTEGRFPEDKAARATTLSPTSTCSFSVRMK
jgi:hypothetical protein